MGPYRLKDRLWELNCGVLGLLLSQAAAFVITSALKNVIGKPRPDIVARCQMGTVKLDPYELATYEMCKQTDHHILKDGFRSFPSGHSSGMQSPIYTRGTFRLTNLIRIIQRHLRALSMRPSILLENFTLLIVGEKSGRPPSP